MSQPIEIVGVTSEQLCPNCWTVVSQLKRIASWLLESCVKTDEEMGNKLKLLKLIMAKNSIKSCTKHYNWSYNHMNFLNISFKKM